MQPSTNELVTPIYLESIRTDPWINLEESAPIHWTASTKSGSMQLHFFRCALPSDKQPKVGDLIGYFQNERGSVEWSSDFTFTTAKGGYVEFRYVAMGGSQPSRVRRLAQLSGHLTKQLMRLLIPLPSGRMLRSVTFMEGVEGAIITIGIIASALLAGSLVGYVGPHFVKWALNDHWPIPVTIIAGVIITTYTVAQEIRFVYWWWRMVTRRFTAYKYRLSQT